MRGHLAHLSPAPVNVSHEVSGILRRCHKGDPHYWLEQFRLGRLSGFAECHDRCGAERHLGRGIVFKDPSSGDADYYILHRIAGQHARYNRILDSLLD